ncbi:MAG: histidine phosphatase family protein [Bradyrhizobium sp.]|nr:histidine phosphatase family protein [Bradyrhizobium sp.]
MKRLAILRHGKSSWADAGMDDFERPLSDRGRKAAGRVGEELKARKLHFDLVLASAATRVRETVAGVGEEYKLGPDVRFDDELYGASEEMLLAVIRALPEKMQSALIVGHNPGLEQVVAALTRNDAAGLRDRVEGKFPTAALAVIDLPVEQWEAVEVGVGTIVELIVPRELD